MRSLPSGGSYRLTKSRTSDNIPTISSYSRSPNAEGFPIQASYEDLKRPEARQLLREQLTSAFPETTRKTSQESVKPVKMPFKEKLMRRSSNLEVGANASAKSSSSTVDSVGVKRLSAVTEQSNRNDSETLDIERAILLLQELKKTASPHELVALHRALLPTKDVETVVSPGVSTQDQRMPLSPAPTFQRRSALPPGLATRGGFGEDLLRKPGEAAVEPQRGRPEKRTGWFEHTSPASINSLAALDLAEDASGARAATPLDFAYSQFGAYGHGTLRVTNGTASPEPSVVTIVSRDLPAPEELKDNDGYFACSSGRPSLDNIQGRASVDILPGRPSVDSLRGRGRVDVSIRPSIENMRGHISVDVLPGRMSEESLPIRERILNSDKAQQQRQQRAQRLSGVSLTSATSQESLKSQTPLRVNTKLPRQSMERESSPLSADAPTPRFQQRWSHRASQISAEYVADCELTASPYDEKNALMNFASRLSTVWDSDGDDVDVVRGDSVAALSRLEGTPEHPEPHTADAIGSARTSNEHTYPSQVPQYARPSPPHKVDSGYGSDGSFLNLQRKTSVEAGSSAKPYFAGVHNLNKVQEKDETASIADAQSLYTFEDILKTPSLLSGLMTTTPPQSVTKPKKSSPLLRLHSLKTEKHSSLPTMPESVTQNSTDSVPTIASMQSSPGDQKKGQHIAKQQKKLQKPMPASMKKQRKEEGRKLKEVSVESSAPSLPALPFEMAAAHAKRLSDQPSSAGLDRTFGTFGSVDKHGDLPSASPVEPMGDVMSSSPAENIPETKRSSSRRRSKSRGRKRSSSVRQTSSTEHSPEVQRSWSIANLRNRSQSRARSQSQKRSSADVVMTKSSLTVEQDERGGATSPGDEHPPAFTDFTSVARTLGSGSYDISTNQFKRNAAPVPGAIQHQLQSPWMISTGLVKPKSTRGMNSEMAAELARLKSRDIVNAETKPWHERPRMAIPSMRKKERSSSGPAPPSTSVEDRFPDWQSKPASRENSPQRPQVSHRPHSMYAESIPPMPELPADVDFKSSRADLIMAKKLKDKSRTSPGSSARNSAEVPQEGKANLAKKMAQFSRQSEPKVLVDEKTLALLHPTERPAAKPAPVINVKICERNGSSSELSSTGGSDEHEEVEPVASPTHDARHSGWPGWEQQAKLWKIRRESLGQTLRQEDERLQRAETPPISRQPSKSPSIVVSRYVTPLAAETAARANANQTLTDIAAQHANAYRGLIGINQEKRPAKQDIPRTDSAVSAASTSTFVTVKSWDPQDPRAAKQDVPRTGTATSTQTYRTTTSVVTTTSAVGRSGRPNGGYSRTTSGKYIAYSPAQESVAERSRAYSLAKLTGESPPVNASTQSLGWSQTSANNSTLSLGTPRGSHQSKGSPDSVQDRYSGGLDYGWERGVGFSGSAGTRHSGTSARRKSLHVSEEFGLDLSDVPVFLQKLR